MTTETRKMIPGSGVDCVCGEHRERCRFGHGHSWSSYVPAALVSNFGIDRELAERGLLWCYTCEAVHVPTDEERADWNA